MVEYIKNTLQSMEGLKRSTEIFLAEESAFDQQLKVFRTNLKTAKYCIKMRIEGLFEGRHHIIYIQTRTPPAP